MLGNPEVLSPAAKVGIALNNYTVDPQSDIGKAYAQLGGQAVLGTPLSNVQMMPDGVGSYQAFQSAVLFYSPVYGIVSISLAIYHKWLVLLNETTAEGNTVRDYLGYPVSNSFTIPNGTQVAYFEGGMIVSLVSKQAYTVYGPIYARYRDLDGVNGLLGLPTADEQPAANGGRFSTFHNGDIYWTSSTGAYEVHGAIRERWLALGGAGGFLGYPLNNETPVLSGTKEVGRFNQFQGGSIYWSPATGAWEVHGDIRKGWLEKYGGPTGSLGFPMSNETSTPSQNGRYNNFQKGVLLWRNSYDAMFAVTSMDVFLERFDSKGTHTWAEAHLGTNIWLYVKANVKASTGESFQCRMPNSGNWGTSTHNVEQSILNIPVLHGETVVTASFDGWDALAIEDDVHLGMAQTTFNIDNLWGLNQDPNHWNGDFNAVFSGRPHVLTDPNASFRKSMYWAFANFKTPLLSWSQFCQTFRDVSENDDSSYFLHPFENAYYSWVYKTLAASGNCFGMCLASIYAQVGHSVYGEPIFSVPPLTGAAPDPAKDAGVINEINVKHGYQIGAACIDWFVGKFISGQTHDPVRAFKESREQFASGNYPILSLSNDAVFSEAHAVRPYFWDDSNPNHWVMHVANPNNPAAKYTDTDPPCVIDINPKTNTFTFKFSSKETWVGTDHSGGRMFSIPFNVLCEQPRTPFIEFIVALLTGGVLLAIMGGADTQQITDQNGRTFLESEDTNALTLAASNLGVTQGVTLPQRRVVADSTKRIPNLAQIPFIHRANQPNLSQVSLDSSVLQVLEASKPAEVYYLKQNAPTHRQKTPKPEPSVNITGTAAVLPQQMNVAATTKIVDASALNLSAVGSFLGNKEVTAITHAITLVAQQPYQWLLMSPSFSAIVNVPAASGGQDAICVQNPGAHNQVLCIQPPAGSAAKPVQVTLMGAPSLLGSTSMRQFEIRNASVAAGQALKLHISDGGQSLHIENTGPALTFDLSIRTANSANAMVELQRSSVKIDSQQVLSLAPHDWTPTAFAGTPVQVSRLDQMSGKILDSHQI